MRSALIVAGREAMAYIATRGFWISLLILPLVFAAFTTLPALTERTVPVRVFTVIDGPGGYAGAIETAFQRNYDGLVASGLSRYLEALGAGPALTQEDDPALRAIAPGLSRSEREVLIGDAGGLDAVLAAADRLIPDEVPAYTPPKRRFVYVPPPDDLAAASPDGRRALIADYLAGDRKVRAGDGSSALYAVLVLPTDYDAEGTESQGTAAARLFTNDLTENTLADRMEDFLRAEVRRRALTERGVNPEVVDQVSLIQPRMELFQARQGETDNGKVEAEDRAPQIAAFAFAYLLWVLVFSTSSLLLTNIIEEKSNRIVEILLSAVTPGQLMIGKLLGVALISILTLTGWVIGGGAVLYLIAGGDQISTIVTVLQKILETPLLPAFLFYFINGYLLFGAIYLAIGASAESLKDAQSLLGPVMLFSFAPVVLIYPVIENPDGVIAQVLSWIPIWAPFFMVIRLPTEPPLAEALGSAALLMATTILMLWGMGRVFRQSLLRTGQPPRFLELLKQVWAKPRD